MNCLYLYVVKLLLPFSQYLISIKIFTWCKLNKTIPTIKYLDKYLHYATTGGLCKFHPYEMMAIQLDNTWKLYIQIRIFMKYWLDLLIFPLRVHPPIKRHKYHDCALLSISVQLLLKFENMREYLTRSEIKI